MSKFNKERNGCVDVFKTDLILDAYFEGRPEIPRLEKCEEFPSKLIPFSQAIGSKDYDQWIHFYEDDCKFERIWNKPRRYINVLKKFKGVITPDFSVYRDLPEVMQEWNIYRSRVFGYALQREGLNVIVNLRYGDERTYETACLGVPKHASIAVGTHGVMKDKEDRFYFKEGLDYAVRKLKPKTIVVYGTAPGEVFGKHVKSGIQILQFDSLFSQKHRKER